MTTTIAIVDDEPNILKAIERTFRREHWTLLSYTSPSLALKELANREIDIVISDYKMPEMSGTDFLRAFKEFCPSAGRLMLSGQSDFKGMLEAINSAEVFRYLLKPWNDQELISTVKQALEFKRLQQENLELAELVRSQSQTLKKQLAELKRLEAITPGITQVDWADDGSIDLSGEFEEK